MKLHIPFLSFFVEKINYILYSSVMRIAIDCRMIGSGGIGSYISALLPFFVKNHECLLIGKESLLKKYDELPDTKNTRIINCELKTFGLRELLFFPSKIAKQINSCDIFYSPYCNIPSGIKIPVFSTIHDVVFLDVPGLASKSGTFIRKLFYKYAVKKSRAIFTVSDFSKSRIQETLSCVKPIICTYNAVPDWFFENTTSGKVQKEDSILFVGNIKKHKGLSVLVNAFIKARKQGFTSTLKIVGNSENFRTADKSIFSLIEEAKDAIQFTGKISDPELKVLYKKTKRLIQPSFYEGFGMPPMEAMSLGTKVIMSDIPVFKEIYKDFPVTYFCTGDSQDLCNKLMTIANESDEVENLPDTYSFEKTYNIITSTLEEMK